MRLSRLSSWLLLLIPVVLACGLWQLSTSLSIDIGGLEDQDVAQGFYKRENTDTSVYRWSTPRASLILPMSYAPGWIQLRGTPAPDGTLVHLGISEASSVALPPQTTGMQRQYHVLWTPDAADNGWARLGINAQIAGERAEERELGMLLDGVTLVSARMRGAPPLQLLLILAVLPFCITGFFRLAGLGSWPSLAVGLLLGTMIVVAWHLRPLWLQYYMPFWVPALLVGCALLWWTGRAFAIPDALGYRMLVAFVAVAGLMPFYLIQKYGFGSWFNWTNLPLLGALVALALPWSGPRLRRSLLGIITVAIIGYAIFHYYDAFAVDYAVDFLPLFRGPRSFWNGQPLYDLEAIRRNNLSATFKYPPFFALVMGPITGIFIGIAIQIWRAANAVLLLASAFMLWRWSRRPLRAWSTIALIYMILAFQPMADTLGYAQVDIIILFGLCAALLPLARGRWGWFGAALALPAVIKLYPAYILGVALTARRWRSLLGFAGAFVLLTAASVAILGLPVHLTFLRDVLPYSGGGTGWVENQTINGFLNRLLDDSIRLLPDTPGLARTLTYAGAGIVTLLTVLRSRRMTPEASMGLWIVSMLIILPASWIHYEVVLLIPFYQLFVRIEHSPTALPWRAALLYILSWALLCYGNQWTFYDGVLHGPAWELVLSYKLYALMLLWAAIAFDPTTNVVEVAADEEHSAVPEQSLRVSAPAVG